MDNHEEEIAKALKELPRVSAPDNFEGTVRTRIAEARPSGSTLRPMLLLGAKFALPLLLLVFLGVFLISSEESSTDHAIVPPPVADDAAPAVATFDSSPLNRRQSDPVVEKTNSEPRRPSEKRNMNGISNGLPRTSEDFARSQDNSTLFPRGVDPRKAIVRDKNPPTGNISPVSVLAMIGVTSRCTPEGCMASEVRAGGVAQKSGIEVGDLIEAIDDRLIGSTRSLPGSFSVRSLRVLRDGRRLTISLTRN